jgi:hypothetical protein
MARALSGHVPAVLAMAAQGGIIQRFSATTGDGWCSFPQWNADVGTNTIHVNGLLRILMYSNRFDAAKHLAASQGLERRMTHLTADRAITANLRARAFGLTRPAPLSKRPAAHHSFRAGLRISCCFLANFLELRGAGFHYSVIHGDATVAPAPAFANRPLLNEDVPTSASGTATASTSPREPADDE